MSEETNLNPVELATELTIAWLGNQNNRVQADDARNADRAFQHVFRAR